MLWHDSHNLENCDAIVVPGGFAYGDYLRTGAIARFAPIMQQVSKFAASGGLVIGICNGFQILCEAGLLPGALMRNAGLKYICKFVNIRVENADTPFTNACKPGEVLRIPIGHMEGNYYCDDADAGIVAKTKPNRFPLLHQRRPNHSRRQSERLTRQHRRHLQ